MTGVKTGYWSVKIRRIGGEWTVFAAPRGNTMIEPYTIASSTSKITAETVAARWFRIARTAVGIPDYVVYAGHGSAPDERQLPAWSIYADSSKP